MNPKPYPSDLTSQQWAVLKPLLPPARTGGRPRKTEMRSVVNAIFYRNRNGCIWRALPHDFPPWRTVYNYFAAWKRDGTWKAINDALRRRVRQRAGRQPTQGHRIKIGELGRMANPAFGENLSFCGTSSHLFTMFAVALVITNKYNLHVQ